MTQANNSATPLERRAFLGYMTSIGLGGTLMPGVLWTQAAHAAERITAVQVAAAEAIAGLEFTDDEREAIARGLNRLRDQYAAVRAVPLPNDIPPALEFNPEPPGYVPPTSTDAFTAAPSDKLQSTEEREIAFANIRALAGALRVGRITSTTLTKLYLDRLKRIDPQLHCVVNLTEQRALEQADRADALLAQGDADSLLCGIPWGAKDLLAVKGYPTTWGAMPFKDQRIDTDAAVVEKLDQAGAVLVAKLTLGALAQGDVWFGGRTNSPWNVKRGSSGSSAGPAAATAAGLVSFGIGSETNGSIVSPATVCGLTGLRPTFGRVSRYGAMALSWSMDKLGPMCRSADDCAIVFNAIRGRDDRDPTTVDRPFQWYTASDPAKLRLGYVEAGFAESPREADTETLRTFESMGYDLVPIELPDLPYNDLMFVLMSEAAAAFDDLTRSNLDDQLVSQGGMAWPNTFRTHRFVPAVEYIQANRLRTLLIREMANVFRHVDAYLTPTLHALLLTNLTGHPMLSMPNGANRAGEPTSVGIVGSLYAEEVILALAAAYQSVTTHHTRRPPVS